ncbi:hypothetical protein T484DRAFT_1909597 [Baffinella frigidus]|nr:hypothetical protein T484DRAFT_1909597 [Cryptophyta sp. CCMP2293]
MANSPAGRLVSARVTGHADAEANCPRGERPVRSGSVDKLEKKTLQTGVIDLAGQLPALPAEYLCDDDRSGYLRVPIELEGSFGSRMGPTPFSHLSAKPPWNSPVGLLTSPQPMERGKGGLRRGAPRPASEMGHRVVSPQNSEDHFSSGRASVDVGSARKVAVSSGGRRGSARLEGWGTDYFSPMPSGWGTDYFSPMAAAIPVPVRVAASPTRPVVEEGGGESNTRLGASWQGRMWGTPAGSGNRRGSMQSAASRAEATAISTQTLDIGVIKRTRTTAPPPLGGVARIKEIQDTKQRVLTFGYKPTGSWFRRGQPKARVEQLRFPGLQDHTTHTTTTSRTFFSSRLDARRPRKRASRWTWTPKQAGSGDVHRLTD